MENIEFLALKEEILACKLCAQELPLPAKPILQIHPDATILIAGQAPGRRAHMAGRPFDDPSGERLRDWLGISQDVFYDETKVALIPMGFCFPGSGSSGDLPPRKECAKTWRKRLLDQLNQIELIIVLGAYAQEYHLKASKKCSVTAHVLAWQDDLNDNKIALPHPSPRNNRWLQQNPWFESDVLPELKRRVQQALKNEA